MFVNSLQINELSCMFVSHLVVRMTIICAVVIDWLLALNTCSQGVWKSSISIGNSMICGDIWHKCHKGYFKILIRNFTSR